LYVDDYNDDVAQCKPSENIRGMTPTNGFFLLAPKIDHYHRGRPNLSIDRFEREASKINKKLLFVCLCSDAMVFKQQEARAFSMTDLCMPQQADEMNFGTMRNTLETLKLRVWQQVMIRLSPRARDVIN
jgi:hypothetical protein